jgi:transcriptional regulator with XRE-family HTH domain
MGNLRRYRNCVGPLIRKARVASELSQDELAIKLQLAGLSLDRTGVAKIESGLRSVFDYELAAIAKTLNTTTDVLFPNWHEISADLPDLLKGQKSP